MELTILQDKNIKKLNEEINDMFTMIQSTVHTVSRISDSNHNGLSFNTLDSNKLAEISNNMVEINRAICSFGRKNTNTTNKLMTLQMLNGTNTIRILRQCLAQIEQKRTVIKDTIFDIMEKKILLEELEDNLKHNTYSDFDIARKKLKIVKTISDISDSMIYIESAFKDLYSFQEAYNQIKKNNNVPDDWNEKTVEENEIKFHIRQAFQLAYRDLQNSGRANPGTMEYINQFGMNVSTVYMEAGKYLNEENSKLQKNIFPTYDEYEEWLNEMSEKYEDSYKNAMKRIGLDTLYNEDFLFKG